MIVTATGKILDDSHKSIEHNKVPTNMARLYSNAAEIRRRDNYAGYESTFKYESKRRLRAIYFIIRKLSNKCVYTPEEVDEFFGTLLSMRKLFYEDEDYAVGNKVDNKKT